MHLILKIKICVIRLTPWKWSILPVTCSALGDLHFYTKHILAHDNIIISVQGLQKISDRLYIRVYVEQFITILYITKFSITNDRYNRYQISNKYQINGEMYVNYPSLLNLVRSVIIINAKYVYLHCITPVSCTASLLQRYWTVV